jgi:hypothetical protein
MMSFYAIKNQTAPMLEKIRQQEVKNGKFLNEDQVTPTHLLQLF